MTVNTSRIVNKGWLYVAHSDKSSEKALATMSSGIIKLFCDGSQISGELAWQVTGLAL